MTLNPTTLWQIDGKKYGSSGKYSFLGFQKHWGQSWNSKMLAPWKDSLTNIDSRLNWELYMDPTKISRVKDIFFPVVVYGCKSWTIKKAESWWNDAFALWCWRILFFFGSYLRVPCSARRSNELILKEINPEYSLEGLMLKLKLQFLAIWWEDLTHWKRPWCWERLRTGGEGDERGWDGWMASLTHWTWVWTNSGKWWEIRRVIAWCSAVHGVSKSQTQLNDWITEMCTIWKRQSVKCSF